MMKMADSWHKLELVLAKACQSSTLATEETAFLLELSDESQMGALFKTARDLRLRHFGDKVYL